MFTLALFIIVKNFKELIFPSVSKQINKVCYFPILGYYKAIKMNGFDLSGTS